MPSTKILDNTSTNGKVLTKDIPNGDSVTLSEGIREILKHMFAANNDTVIINTTVAYKDGSYTDVEFEIQLSRVEHHEQ